MIKEGKEGQKVWMWLAGINAIVRGVLTQDYQRSYCATVNSKIRGTVSCPPQLISTAVSKRQASQELRKAIQKDIRLRIKLEFKYLQPILDAGRKWGIREQYVVTKQQ
ncbi:MAG: hypothetical protein WC375_00260 [Methanomassiliicoccales archaeon]|jgi:hypothetical protein